MSDKIKPQGIMIFKPHENAPDFVKGQMVVTLEDLIKFFKEQEEHHTEYNGKAQLKIDLLEGEHGLYPVLNTFKARKGNDTSDSMDDLKGDDGLPF